MPQKWFSLVGDGGIVLAVVGMAKNAGAHIRGITLSRWLDQIMGAIFTTLAMSIVGAIATWMLSIPATLRQVENIAMDAAKLRSDVNQIMNERKARSAQIDSSQAQQDARLLALEIEHKQMAEKCALACNRRK